MQRTFPILADENEQNLAYIDNLTKINQRLADQNEQLKHEKHFNARCADVLGFLLLIMIAIVAYLMLSGVSHV